MYNFLYLIQDGKDLDWNVYKIGKTTQDPSQRFKGYLKGTRPIRISEVDDCSKRESELIKIFMKKYILYRGREYFSGILNEMVLDFTNFCDSINLENNQQMINNYINNKETNNQLINDNNNFKCNLCFILFKSKFSLDRHQNKKIKCNLHTDYKCKKCNKFFREKRNLEQHIDKKICKIPMIKQNKLNNDIINENKMYNNLESILAANLSNLDRIFVLKAFGVKLDDTSIQRILDFNTIISVKIACFINNL